MFVLCKPKLDCFCVDWSAGSHDGPSALIEERIADRRGRDALHHYRAAASHNQPRTRTRTRMKMEKRKKTLKKMLFHTHLLPSPLKVSKPSSYLLFVSGNKPKNKKNIVAMYARSYKKHFWVVTSRKQTSVHGKAGQEEDDVP